MSVSERDDVGGTPASPKPEAKPLLDTEQPGPVMRLLVWVFVLGPLVALAWGVVNGWRPTLVDLAIGIVFFTITCAGIGTGFHRYFTHGAFKAKRGFRVALAIAGSLAGEGPPIQWVADHRRHHKFSDREGDPHSPWAYGTTPWALTKGFWHAHWGWLFNRKTSNRDLFAPDLQVDADIKKVDAWFMAFVALSLGTPALIGGLVTWSWQGALSAFFWAGVVRFFFLHHVTWSINSICHMVGERPFESRDQARNFWPLALFSFGESWHNLHHAEPSCARHGVDRGQIDVNARIIWIAERFGWAYNVKWPETFKRLEDKRRAA
jgi:stearoyl-CoA desaturase (delta-9 desaturase)